MAENFPLTHTISVQICYAEPGRQIVIEINVPEKTTLIQAIQKSDIANQLSLQIRKNEVGIFGKKQSFDTVLKAYDRVEIYRPLLTTPQETRRLRANLDNHRKSV